MLFNSLQFLAFFPVVSILFFVLPHRYRWSMLLLASCVFYMVFIPKYILILAVLIVIDYFAAIWIERSQGPARKGLLILSIAATCIALFFFKYHDFFAENINTIARVLHWNYSMAALKLILPIGLSFHTFQSLSYVIEVYRGNQKTERHFGIYALYVMFFPQLVAGPIERPRHLLHQFHEEHQFRYRAAADGLKLMAWGLFQKVVVADNLARTVDMVFSGGNLGGGYLIIGTVLFAFQIYCDFSGYSDVARGSAMFLGFRLMKNFDRPYLAHSISEFWRRWHISLSSWLRDYIYIPLGGNRVGTWRMSLNLLITFIFCGLWHGAKWTYVCWGAINGLYLVFGALTSKLRENLAVASGITRFPRIRSFFQILTTFSLVCIGWIFFRSDNMDAALKTVTVCSATIFNGILALPGWSAGAVHALISDEVPWIQVRSTILPFLWPAAYISVIMGIQLLQSRGGVLEISGRWPVAVRWTAYFAIIIAIMVLGYHENQRPFIYFQF